KHGREPLWDCVEAKKYLKSLGYVDQSKIGIIGGSYGGYMVLAALAFKPEGVQCGCGHFRRGKLDSHARIHSPLLGILSQGALQRNWRPTKGPPDVDGRLSAPACRPDYETAHRASGSE